MRVMAAKRRSDPIDELHEQVSHMLDTLNPHQPISATVTFVVDRDREHDFRRRAHDLAEATRRMTGVNVFEYEKRRPITGPDPEDPEYLIYEDWQTVTLFRAQWDSPHLRKFQDKVLELLVSGQLPDLRFYHGWRAGGGGVPPQGGHAPVLRTGQTKCFDASGEKIDCDGTGQDGDVRAGVPSPPNRFELNRNGTVTDRLTGLVWLRDADPFGEVPWETALTKVKTLRRGICGLEDESSEGDWRVPNVNELLSLLALDNRHGPPLPTGHPFTNVRTANYWTSSTVAAAPVLGWYVAMAVGPHVFDLKTN